jgi:hypothetical protein
MHSITGLSKTSLRKIINMQAVDDLKLSPDDLKNLDMQNSTSWHIANDKEHYLPRRPNEELIAWAN